MRLTIVETLALLALAVFIAFSAACVLTGDGPTGKAEMSSGAPSVVGSWRLAEWTVQGGAPRCSEEEGGPSGQIIYSTNGYMSAQVGCENMELEPLDETGGQEAIRQWSRRHFSYYGTYVIDTDAQTVTHHVMGSSSPVWVGSERVRRFNFDGPDRIILTPVESGARLVWLRN